MLVAAMLSMSVLGDCGSCFDWQLCCKPSFCESCTGASACPGNADVAQYFRPFNYHSPGVVLNSSTSVVCYTTFQCIQAGVCLGQPGGWYCKPDWMNGIDSAPVRNCTPTGVSCQ